MTEFKMGDRVKLNVRTRHYCDSSGLSVLNPELQIRGVIVRVTNSEIPSINAHLHVKWDLCSFRTEICDGYPIRDRDKPWVVPEHNGYEVVYHNKKNTTLTIQGKVYE